ncbi:MAG TPA: RcpC/CpaB family pilus assembly protein [Elusimicrobiota bacterium]|jgi:Flp pilus assembly protein CpaB|nr:RcpC/CpaB family pilus assembly protein [Elusimicrobiota bacterium]
MNEVNTVKSKTAALAGIIGLAVAASVWSADKEAPASRAVPVPPGYRAVGIQVSESQIPFIQRGDRVDVMVTFDTAMESSGGRMEKYCATLLQNVLVADIYKPSKAMEKGAISILVNPNEAQYLALGPMQGVLSLAVRAPGDKDMKPLEMASFRRLFK